MRTNPKPAPQRLSFTVAEVVAASGFGRSTVFKEIRNGALPVVRIGRRVMVRVEDFQRWFRPRGRNEGGTEPTHE